jgi:hypothetical protein
MQEVGATTMATVVGRSGGAITTLRKPPCNESAELRRENTQEAAGDAKEMEVRQKKIELPKWTKGLEDILWRQYEALRLMFFVRPKKTLPAQGPHSSNE